MNSIKHPFTYPVTSKNQELVLVRLYDRFRGIGVAGDQILHVRITQRSRDGQYSVNAVVEDQTTSTGNTSTFVLVAALVVVRKPESPAITAENYSSISHIRSVQDALAAGVVS